MHFRLRLVHTLFALLSGAVLIAVLSMGTLVAWHLRDGFANLLIAGDTDQLDRFTSLVSRAVESPEGYEAFLQGRLDMRKLVRQFSELQTKAPADFSEARPEGVPPPSPPGAEVIAERVAVFGMDENRLIGRPFPINAIGSIDRPILRESRTVGWVRMLPRKTSPDLVQRKFLRSQYIGIAAVAAVLMLFALICAWWVSRRWVKPLMAVQEASARIACGEFDYRHRANDIHENRSDEIGDVVRNINQMARALHSFDASRKRWIADISHELRTPLSILQGEIEALLDGVRPIRKEALTSLKDEVVHISKIVDDLHTLALSDLKALSCSFVEFDLMSLVVRVTQRFQARFDALNLVFTISAEVKSVPQALNKNDVQWLVKWDAFRFEQVLVNLIENSIRYTNSPGKIRLSVYRSFDCVELAVEDSAPGVPVSALGSIFEPLYRVDASRVRCSENGDFQRKTGGSGLGLSVSEAIVKAHGGEVSAIGSQLGGLRVSIKLPLDSTRIL